MSERSGHNITEPRALLGTNLCWSCKSDAGPEPVCQHCVKLQPLGRDSDYFRVMGLLRKLDLDPRVLEPVFHALSRRFHPDMYRMASPRERMIALENSAVLNQAYRALRDPFERAEYLLRLERGRDQGNKPSAPAELFDEILEIQELLGEFRLAEEGGEKETLRAWLSEQRDELAAVQERRAAHLTGNLFRQWDKLADDANAPAEEREKLLAEMRRILDERAYLRRVLTTLHEALG
jgi:molecular chaperone HscB